MKKLFFSILGLALACGLQAGNYTRNAQEYFDYTGEAIDAIVAVDFSDLQPTDVLYDPAASKHDTLNILEFQQLGLYKFCYYASRTIGGATYGPVLWNSNDALDGKNNVVPASHRPAIYFPTCKNGIYALIVSGWGASASTMFVNAKNAKGEWQAIDELVPGTGYIQLSTIKCVSDTIVINSADVKTLSISRNGGGYFFLTNVQLIPMGHDKDVVLATDFSLLPETASMEASQTLQLTTKVHPFNVSHAIQWTSSNDAVAIVSQTGLITAVAGGDAYVIGEIDGLKDTCAVHVEAEIPVTSVSLDETTFTLGEGKYARLNATVLPTNASNPTVTWSSSNEKAVTVDQTGLIYGVAEGKATITATAGEKKATCEVTVEWIMPDPVDYQLVEYYKDCYYYEWYGEEQTEPIYIDFTKLTYDSLPDPSWPDFNTTVAQGHSDQIVQRNNVGFYQWVIYEGRNLESDQAPMSVANVLFNGGYTYLNGERIGAGAIAQCKRPAIYLPTFKNGIKQVRITGVSHNNSRSCMVGYKAYQTDSHGQDSAIMAGLPYLEFGKVWDEYVIDTQNESVMNMRLSRNSTDYWFIGSIEVIPFGGSNLETVRDTRYEVRAVTGGILFNAKEDVDAVIYNFSGMPLHNIHVRAGIHVMVPMAPGAYIVNNTKVLVNR